MKDERTRKAASEPRERQLSAQLKALAAVRDEEIDLSDIPEIRDWSGAQRGVFYRPVKRQLTLRLDADVVAWFQSRTPRGYQTAINRALREYVHARAKRARRIP